MITVQQDTLDVLVYSEEGKLLTSLTYNKKVSFLRNEGKTYLQVEDAVQNTVMRDLLGRKVRANLSDYEKELFNKNEVSTIRFNKEPKGVALKLIAKGIEYDAETAEVGREVKIIVPSVELVQEDSTSFEVGVSHCPTYLFEILPFNDNGDLYDIQYKKVE